MILTMFKPMFKLWQLPLVFTLAGVLLSCPLSNAPAQTVPQIAEKALAATVSLEMRDRNGAVLFTGSGFFVRPNLIATNYHVIEGAARGTAKLVDRHRTSTIEGITAIDKTNDLALLKVTMQGIKSLSLADSDTVLIGETVFVAGNPMGLEGTISEGIISSRRDVNITERFQMTAPISPGSSGGPVLNRKGKVIGVSVATHHGLAAQNLNFAIPSNYLKTLLAQSGTVKTFSETLVQTESQKSEQSQSTYLDFIFRGAEKGELGDYKRAIFEYTQAIRLKPDSDLAYYARGEAKYSLRQYAAAIADFDTAIRLTPDFALAYINRGIAKAELEQYHAAISDFDTAIRLKPDYATAYYNRGNAKAELEQHRAAISDFDSAIRLAPDSALAYHNRGNAKYKLRQHRAAIIDYDSAIRLKPDDADAYISRGVAKANLGQHFAAIIDYDSAIRLAPDSALAYHNRGNAKYKLRQHRAAIGDYDTFIRLVPDDASAYYNRGVAKADLGQHRAAISDYDTAIRLKPDDALAYINRGNVKADLGQRRAAISDYDTAIRLKPDDASAYYNRGVAKLELGRTSSAKRDFQTALKLAEQAGDESFNAKIMKALSIIPERSASAQQREEITIPQGNLVPLPQVDPSKVNVRRWTNARKWIPPDPLEDLKRLELELNAPKDNYKQRVIKWLKETPEGQDLFRRAKAGGLNLDYYIRRRNEGETHEEALKSWSRILPRWKKQIKNIPEAFEEARTRGLSEPIKQEHKAELEKMGTTPEDASIWQHGQAVGTIGGRLLVSTVTGIVRAIQDLVHGQAGLWFTMSICMGIVALLRNKLAKFISGAYRYFLPGD